VDASEAVSRRLATQRLTSPPLPSAAEVVRLLTCVQSQERDHAFFSLGLRSRRRTYAAVRREYDSGAFLRTHILRPTWHFVLPEDLRWILDLTSARVLASMRARHVQLGLHEPSRLLAGVDLFGELLRDRNFLTRVEIGEAFIERGAAVRPGEELGHLLLVAELEGLICSGPIKGVHHSYALVDEVVPPSPPMEREEATCRLVTRYVLGHGPTSAQDFARWSSLTLTDTRAALAELGDVLEQVDIEGTPHWYDPARPPRRSPAAPRAHLFPTYDEVVLSYPKVGFLLAEGHPHDEHPDPFWAWVVLDEVNVGLWKRTVGAQTVEVVVRLAPTVDRDGRDQVRAAAQRLAEFVERDLDYTEG
jgi:Winged helix DNA-binding domain